MCCALVAVAQEPLWANVNYITQDTNSSVIAGHKLDIYLPNTGLSSYKVIVIIYGSAWFANDAKQAAFEAIGKPLLNAGFAVVAINHRASTEAKFPAQINDVKAAIRFLRANAEQYHLDTSFIGITGYSSGGHLSALAGATNGIEHYTVGEKTINIEGDIGDYTAFSSNVDAVVDWFGPIDMTRMQDCANVKGVDSPEAVLIGGVPADNFDMLALLNPITYLDNNDPQFLVIHGNADNVVPDCQSIYFSDSLRSKGLLADFLVVTNGEHGPITFNESTFKSMVDFFQKQANRNR